MTNTKFDAVVQALVASNELSALASAEEGNPDLLAEFVLKNGFLQTEEARAFVASRIRGEPKKRGNKRTRAQKYRDIRYLIACREIQQELGCTEYAAMKAMVEHVPKLNAETLKSIIQRAKADLKRD